MNPDTATASPWTGLPSDLLLDVVGRLQDAVDIVSFHAVCRTWRDAAALPAPAATHTACLPWILATQNGVLVHSVVNFSRSFHTTSYRASHDVVLEKLHHRASGTNDTNWVATVDGTAAWLFVARPSPRLISLVTGAVVRLPPFPDDDAISRSCENFRGILYGDGTVFLYTSSSQIQPASWPNFIAATLRPGGDAAWTVVKRRLDVSVICDARAAYHDGKILLCNDEPFVCVLTPDTEASGGGGGGMVLSSLEAGEDANYDRVDNYVLVSGGELLWASVVVRHHRPMKLGLPLSVMVHALQEEPGGSGKVRWVARDGRSLDDPVLFLGISASFATQLDSGTACAYFVFGCAVFRYNFGKGVTEFVKCLSPERSAYEPIMWLRPTLLFAPIHKIRERLEGEAHSKK